MRVLIDYRAALSERSGVGEYTHQLARALLTTFSPASDKRLDLTLFSSSWKDRLVPGAEIRTASAVDRRVPVRLLNFAWHRLEWPSAEALAGGRFDVTHSLHPLLMPARSAAQVVTIHDLDFLLHPERTRGEIKRDYPARARDHANRADRVIVVSEFTAREVERLLQVPRHRISVCSPGAPPWNPRQIQPARGYVLFFGTLEPRKNVGALLDAYERFAMGRRSVPPLVLAGKAVEGSSGWLERIDRPPLKGIARYIGYVNPATRRELYEGARILVQPSFDEGFGLTVLEAMTLGVPVVAANRGALPEVLGDAGVLVDPSDPDVLAAAMASLIDDQGLAETAAMNGVRQAQRYTWEQTARSVYAAYEAAVAQKAATAGAGER
ncbi:MAG: glycosyltransferase [Luteitalea sp.]|nr:glycosyltransferase [Luteitalea sp.]